MKFILISYFAFLACGNVYPQAKYFNKVTESMKTFFGDSIQISMNSYKITSEEKAKIKESYKYNIDSLEIFTAYDSDIIVGYGIVDNVKGKSQPITYLTVIDTLGDVIDVNILVYRESHGEEVQNESFRRQFRGMNAQSKIGIGKDIKSISGATISSRSVTSGVNKIIRIFEIIKPSLSK